MCAPVIAAVAIAGAVASANASRQQGKAAQRAANYNADVEERNAVALETAAEKTRAAGLAEAATISSEGSQIIAQGKAVQAASNVQVGTGSAGIWEASTRREVMRDMAATVTNAEQAAEGQTFEASNRRTEAQFARREGRYARRAGNMGAITSLLGGATQAASSYYGNRR